MHSAEPGLARVIRGHVKGCESPMGACVHHSSKFAH